MPNFSVPGLGIVATGVAAVASGASVTAQTTTTTNPYLGLKNLAGALRGFVFWDSPTDALYLNQTGGTSDGLRVIGSAITAFGSFVVGTDPAGPDLMRVGGDITALRFRTSSGSTAMATASFTTISTIVSQGTYEVDWYAFTSGSTYFGTAKVIYDGSSGVVQSKTVGANTDIQLSGSNIQLKQVSGSSATLSWGIRRLL